MNGGNFSGLLGMADSATCLDTARPEFRGQTISFQTSKVTHHVSKWPQIC